MKRLTLVLASLGLMTLTCVASADPAVEQTWVLGGFTGAGAPLHPANTSPRIAYYGTDLGFSYAHAGKVQFLFGDTWATEAGAPIQSSTGGTYDDCFGSVDMTAYPNPAAFSATNIPLIKLGQISNSTQAKAINPGHPMEAFKTPVGGFSNGSREYGIFYTSKPEGCLNDGDCDNLIANLTCDTGLGFFGEEYFDPKGITGACVDGSAFCLSDTMANAFGFPIRGTGFCSDRGSSIRATGETGRIMSMGLKLRVGVRGTTDDRSYTNIKQWLTNRFLNIAVATVQDFVPADGPGFLNQNYNVAGVAGASRRVFLWGRPGFIGVNARGRNLGMYFAYVDMPTAATFSWSVNYYTGLDPVTGAPRFSARESDAVALDLDAGLAGVQPLEPYDVVNQMSIVWVDQLHRWVMFYGGGATTVPSAGLGTCGVVEYFIGSAECRQVVLGDGSIYMRTANDPWGPWTAPQVVITGGDPSVRPLEHEYAPGGSLRHPDCTVSGCAAHTSGVGANEYGFLYGANIIAPWIATSGNGGVDLIWNASTWDPGRVILLRTRIRL